MKNALIVLAFLAFPLAAVAGPSYDNTSCASINASGAGGVTLVNGATITNNTDGSILFSESGEGLSFDFTSNAVALSSLTGVSTFTFPAGITPVASAMTLNGSLTLANSETISNAVNGRIALAANGKNDLILDLGQTTTNRLALSSTAATAFDFGVVTPTFLHQVTAGGASYLVAFATDCGSVITTANDNGVMTLPLVTLASKGCEVTIANTAASAGALVQVAPNASDGIAGSCGAVVLDGTINKAANNTKATHKPGDKISVMSTGVSGTTGWLIVGCQGVWARDA